MIGFAIGAEVAVDEVDRAKMTALFDELGSALIARQSDGSGVLDHAVSIDLGRCVIGIDVTTTAATREQAEELAERTIAEVLAETGNANIEEIIALMRENATDRPSAVITARELVAL